MTPTKGTRPPQSAWNRDEIDRMVQQHGRQCFLGHVDTLPWLACFCEIASNSVEVFGMRGDFTKANRQHTIARDLAVHLDAAELWNYRVLGHKMM